MCYHAAAPPLGDLPLIARPFLIVYYTSCLVGLYNARGQFCHRDYVYIARSARGAKDPYGPFACSHAALVLHMEDVPAASLSWLMEWSK
jgi:hypothetical protein